MLPILSGVTGYEFDNSISGSCSTGSFGRLNFNSLSVTDLSGVSVIGGISVGFQGGFGFSGTISGSTSSDSTLKYNHLI